MKAIKPSSDLNENTPDLGLFKTCLCIHLFSYFFVEISVVSEFHNNTIFVVQITTNSSYFHQETLLDIL